MYFVYNDQYENDLEVNKFLVNSIYYAVKKKEREIQGSVTLDERYNILIKYYLEELKKIKPKKRVIRNWSRPFQYIESLILVKSAFLRRTLFEWKREVLNGCDSFMDSCRIFLLDPFQLYPMIDLLEQICYYIDNQMFKGDCQMNLFEKVLSKKSKRLCTDSGFVEHFSNCSGFTSRPMLHSVVGALIYELRKNYLSPSMATELVDYVIGLVAQEIQDQYLLRLFIDKNYKGLSSNLDAFIPTTVNGINALEKSDKVLLFPCSNISVIAVPEGEKDSFLKWLLTPSYEDFVNDSVIRYFPDMKICLLEDGNHRIAKAYIKSFSSNSSFSVKAVEYDMSLIYDYLDISDDYRYWICLDSDGKKLERLPVADMRIALLYELAKIKHDIYINNIVIDRKRQEVGKPLLAKEYDYVKEKVRHYILTDKTEINLPLDFMLSDIQTNYDMLERVLSDLMRDKKLSKRFKVKCPHCGTSFLLPKDQSNLRTFNDVVECQTCYKKFFAVPNMKICYFSGE